MTSQTINPVEFLDAVDEQWNAHNIEGVLDYFTDDAVLRFVPSPPGAPEAATGKAEIRAIVEPMLSGFHVDSRDHQAYGDTITWMARATGDLFRALGLDAVEALGEALVQDGRMASMTITFTPNTVARMRAAAGQQG